MRRRRLVATARESYSIRRGWDIPKPKPDAKGRLFSFSGAASGGGPQIVAPDGKDILTSGDLQDGLARERQPVLDA